jgi:chemotaxis protein MotB
VGVHWRVNSDVICRSGTAELTRDAAKALREVIALLKEYNLFLVVRGHADPGEARPPYPSNWELSGARAAAVLRHIVEHGKIKATRLRAIAYGDTRPVEPGFDETSKAKNRRVEFHFHRPEVMSYSVVY